MTTTIAPERQTLQVEEENPEPVYGILETNRDNQRFLRDAFFKAHCPTLADLLKEPEALENAGLSRHGLLSVMASSIVKACVEADLDYQMSLAPLPEHYTNPAPSPLT